MTLNTDPGITAIGTTVLAAGLLLTTAGAGIPSAGTYAALMALFLAFVAITVNNYKNAATDPTMGRLLHDPDPRSAHGWHDSGEAGRMIAKGGQDGRSTR